MQQPSYDLLTTQPTFHPMANDFIPPVPTQIHQKITQGEFIDFSVLLHRDTFLDAAAHPLPSTQQSIKRVYPLSCDAGVEPVSISHNPAKYLISI